MKMKRMAMFGAAVVAIAATGIVTASAQEFRQPVQPSRSTTITETTETTTEGEFVDRPRTDGVIPRMARSRKPWQYLNPRAPREYGGGPELVQDDPQTKKRTVAAVGIKLFTIEF